MAKKFILIVIAVLLLASCGGKKSEVTRPIFFDCSCESLSVYQGLEDSYFIKGEIKTSEVIDTNDIMGGLTVRGANVPVKWTHSEDGLTHSFIIHKLIPAAKPYDVEVFFCYPEYGVKDPIQYEYTVPAKGNFIVIGEKVSLEPYCFEIFFSSAIDKKQAFKDLVTVDGGGKLKFLIDANKLKIYPTNRKKDTQIIIVSSLLKNVKGEQLGTDWTKDVKIPSAAPSVKFITKGSILPSANGMKVYFQSIHFAKVQVRVRKIFENNMLQFLQSTNLNASYTYNIDDVSRIIADTTFVLDEPSSPKLRNLSSYGLDVSKLIKPEKGALYKVEIRGREKLAEDSEKDWESDYYFGNYRDYSQRTINLLCTDLGVIAKGSDDGEYTFFVTDILTAKPVSGARVKVYDRVNQLIGEGNTSPDGCFVIKYTDYKPFTAIVSKGGDKTYVKLEEGLSLSLSNFEVDGAAVRSGQKGFIFGERGVWRPGDNIYLTFISMLSEGKLPSGHPVTAVLKNPHDQIIQTIVNNNGFNGMYAFNFKTAADAPTGNWQVEVTAGGQTYTKTLKIETVKPNRLKIDLILEDEPIISAEKISGKVEVSWLAGNPGKNLKTVVNGTITKGRTSFEKYKNYIFEDPSRSFSSGDYSFGTGTTDENGSFSFSSFFQDPTIFPGFMNVFIEETVYEPSGDFSVDNHTAILSPYKRYVGIKIPEQTDKWGSKYLDIEKKHIFDLVSVNKDGIPVSASKLEVEIYKMGWNWWWGSSSSESLAMYSRDSYNKPYKILNVPLKGGLGSFELGFEKEESGFYLFRVVDPIGKHSASTAVLVQNNYSDELVGGADGAARLQTSLDKEKYNVGETARLTIPSAEGAKALVCIEKGEKLLKSFWVTCNSEKTVIPIALKDGMAPNVYASVTLVQPHSTVLNDAPIRMFGVQRICVEDPSSHLCPIITVSDEVRPESRLSISISEKEGKKMSYVLAIVDEGLLSLTKYKTPDPWKAFYAIEALGVRTWDIFDMVIGAYGAKMERLFAIGGSDDASSVPVTAKVQRFKPVSIFLGPFTISAGKSVEHEVVIPPYLGSLRVMAIATDGRAQGSAERNVTVRKPLMVQATLPRVIGTDEEVKVPVTIFATKENLGNVTVSLETNEAFTIIGDDSQSVSVITEGEEMVYFKIKAASAEAVGKLKILASCAVDKATENIEIGVRDPNPYVIVSKTALLAPNGKKSMEFALAGRAGTNSAKVEVSTLPAIDLDYRFGYLSEYAHSCLEQLVSCAFPLLYLGDLTSVTEEKAIEYENIVKGALSRLSAFSTTTGGFTYWPSADSGISFWGTVYAAHFLVCAKAQGYAVPATLLNSALTYMRTRAVRQDDSSLERAYAFYVLAISGEAPRGAMNRMREGSASLGADSRWFLAAAYAADGKKDVAREIVSVKSSSASSINSFSSSFDSYERELSTATMVYIMLGETERAFETVSKLSEMLNDRGHWMSTQSTAWGLRAVAAYATSSGATSSGVDVSVSAAEGKEYLLKGLKPITETSIQVGNGTVLPLKIVNNSDAQTYVVVSSRGVPEKGYERNKSAGLSLSVSYYSMSGLSIDPTSLEQGTDFKIVVSITNTNPLVDYTNLVLTQIFPSGWEFKRDRQDGYYQDFRDDRVFTYFDLMKGSVVQFTTRATATYSGRFYLPAVSCEAMYDGGVNATVKGKWCEVK